MPRTAESAFIYSRSAIMLAYGVGPNRMTRLERSTRLGTPHAAHATYQGRQREVVGWDFHSLRTLVLMDSWHPLTDKQPKLTRWFRQLELVRALALSQALGGRAFDAQALCDHLFSPWRFNQPLNRENWPCP